MSLMCVVALRRKQVSGSLLTVTPLMTVVAAVPPGPHFVVKAFANSPVPGEEEPIPRNPPVATFADIPVSVSTQLVPAVGQNTLAGWEELHVPSAGAPAVG